LIIGLDPVVVVIEDIEVGIAACVFHPRRQDARAGGTGRPDGQIMARPLWRNLGFVQSFTKKYSSFQK
jgi:hypothetical protein